MKKVEAFRFKQFSVEHNYSAQKIGTDSVLLATWVQSSSPKKILDIGSGCGLISFILAQRFPEAQIMGIEIDEASYSESTRNLKQFPWKERVQFVQGNFLDYDFKDTSFDLIISNPPYFADAYLSGNTERDRARHEFSLPHFRLLKKAKNLLHENGKLALILPEQESQKLFHQNQLHCNRLTMLKNKPDSPIKRHLSEWSFEKTPTETDEFVLRDIQGNYSQGYQVLGKDYYLDF